MTMKNQNHYPSEKHQKKQRKQQPETPEQEYELVKQNIKTIFGFLEENRTNEDIDLYNGSMTADDVEIALAINDINIATMPFSASKTHFLAVKYLEKQLENGNHVAIDNNCVDVFNKLLINNPQDEEKNKTKVITPNWDYCRILPLKTLTKKIAETSNKLHGELRGKKPEERAETEEKLLLESELSLYRYYVPSNVVNRAIIKKDVYEKIVNNDSIPKILLDCEDDACVFVHKAKIMPAKTSHQKKEDVSTNTELCVEVIRDVNPERIKNISTEQIIQRATTKKEWIEKISNKTSYPLLTVCADEETLIAPQKPISINKIYYKKNTTNKTLPTKQLTTVEQAINPVTIVTKYEKQYRGNKGKYVGIAIPSEELQKTLIENNEEKKRNKNNDKSKDKKHILPPVEKWLKNKVKDGEKIAEKLRPKIKKILTKETNNNNETKTGELTEKVLDTLMSPLYPEEILESSSLTNKEKQAIKEILTEETSNKIFDTVYDAIVVNTGLLYDFTITDFPHIDYTKILGHQPEEFTTEATLYAYTNKTIKTSNK